MNTENIDNEKLWNIVLGELELSLSKASFTTWFSNTSIHDIINNQIIINVPNIFAKEWLEKKYKKDILSSVQKYNPEIISFLCQINQPSRDTLSNNPSILTNNNTSQVSPVHKKVDSLNTPTPPNNTQSFQQNISTKKSSTPSTQKINTSSHSQIQSLKRTSSFLNNLNSKYTFDNFIVSSNNELANAACQSITSAPGRNYNPLFVYGGVGLGKTHLLQATGNKIQENFPHFKIRYVSMERFSNELVDAIQNNKAKEFKNQYIDLDVLILDDIQFLSGKEKAQEEFFHVFESLNQFNKQVILSSDRPPKSISTLEDRLRSRFEGGMIVDVEKPDFETRLAIIEQKLYEKN